jgi:hypothetical protein
MMARRNAAIEDAGWYRAACRVSEQLGELRTKLVDFRAEAERAISAPDCGAAVSLARAILEVTE